MDSVFSSMLPWHYNFLAIYFTLSGLFTRKSLESFRKEEVVCLHLHTAFTVVLLCLNSGHLCQCVCVCVSLHPSILLPAKKRCCCAVSVFCGNKCLRQVAPHTTTSTSIYSIHGLNLLCSGSSWMCKESGRRRLCGGRNLKHRHTARSYERKPRNKSGNHRLTRRTVAGSQYI